MYREVSVHQLKQGETFVIYQDQGSAHKGRLGIGLFLLGILGFLISVSPALLAEMDYRLRPTNQEIVVSGFGPLVGGGYASGRPFGNSVEKITPANGNFSLIIPKINVNAPVVENVNPAEETEYKKALTKGLAHAKGTNFPGEGGVIYIFGHSSNYIWDFSPYRATLYSLKYLMNNDKILVVFRNQFYVYRVVDKKILEGDQTSFVLPQDKEVLVLQTCWPPTTDLQRLVIVAEPVETNAVSVSKGSGIALN